MSTERGKRAEAVVAAFLERKGCTILATNWRTRMCEIDVIARKDEIVYFCEVKYRVRNTQGAGLDYVTDKKLRQMRFAAESWVHANRYGGDYQLCAIEVSGPGFAITAVVKDL